MVHCLTMDFKVTATILRLNFYVLKQLTYKALMSKRRSAVYSFYFGDAVGGGGFMYCQIEAIKQKYATVRFVSWRDLKADAINQR
jgi:hypothetical protein